MSDRDSAWVDPVVDAYHVVWFVSRPVAGGTVYERPDATTDELDRQTDSGR
jgi:hypothetical protein